MRSWNRRVGEIKEVRNSTFEVWQSWPWEDSSSAFDHYVAPNPSDVALRLSLLRLRRSFQNSVFSMAWWLVAGTRNGQFLRLVEQPIPLLAA
jgi:hypothetical protein